MTAALILHQDTQIILSLIVAELIQEQNLRFWYDREGHQERVKDLKIVIADDAAMISGLLQRTLSIITRFKVVGIAADGAEAIRLVREIKPHLLVLDISMPIKDGLQTLKEIRAEDSSIVIVMFTEDLMPAIRKICLETGANYFLNKSQIIELIEVCKTVLLAS